VGISLIGGITKAYPNRGRGTPRVGRSLPKEEEKEEGFRAIILLVFEEKIY
jgi:hypothetical protein